MTEEKDMKQMKLSRFCKAFDISVKTAYELVYRRGFPAYKIGGRYYVDVPAYYKWREQHGKTA